jgi:hypothetical protein
VGSGVGPGDGGEVVGGDFGPGAHRAVHPDIVLAIDAVSHSKESETICKNTLYYIHSLRLTSYIILYNVIAC